MYYGQIYRNKLRALTGYCEIRFERNFVQNSYLNFLLKVRHSLYYESSDRKESVYYLLVSDRAFGFGSRQKNRFRLIFDFWPIFSRIPILLVWKNMKKHAKLNIIIDIHMRIGKNCSKISCEVISHARTKLILNITINSY